MNNFCIFLLCTFCVSSMLISEVLCKLRITQRARNMFDFYMTNVTLLWILVCKICNVHSFKFVEYFQFQMDKHAKFIAITSFLLITFNWSSLTPEVVNIHTPTFYILLNWIYTREIKIFLKASHEMNRRDEISEFWFRYFLF